MPLDEPVAALLRDVAARVVMPRFRALAAHEITEKSLGEIVTIADREAEQQLCAGLAALGLDARIIGEEAVEQNPGLLDRVGSGRVWLVDPLDGTANFAAGREPFGIMIALIEDGVAQASWMLDPINDRLCHAERGKGAWCDGSRVTSRGSGGESLAAALGTQFLTEEVRSRVHRQAEAHLRVVPIPRCAAASYPRLVFGENDVALFQRILPWDHAPGALFLCEAGGVVTHWDRSPYRVGGPGKGVLCATDAAAWQFAADVLLGAEAGLIETENCAS